MLGSEAEASEGDDASSRGAMLAPASIPGTPMGHLLMVHIKHNYTTARVGYPRAEHWGLEGSVPMLNFVVEKLPMTKKSLFLEQQLLSWIHRFVVDRSFLRKTNVLNM